MTIVLMEKTLFWREKTTKIEDKQVPGILTTEPYVRREAILLTVRKNFRNPTNKKPLSWLGWCMFFYKPRFLFYHGPTKFIKCSHGKCWKPWFIKLLTKISWNFSHGKCSFSIGFTSCEDSVEEFSVNKTTHLAVLDPEKKKFELYKYVIPKSLKFSHWPSKSIPR